MMCPHLVCMLITSIQRTRPPAAVSPAEYDERFGQPENEPKFGLATTVKLDVAQSQLLQPQTDLNL